VLIARFRFDSNPPTIGALLPGLLLVTHCESEGPAVILYDVTNIK
jgi:hypothetical protein